MKTLILALAVLLSATIVSDAVAQGGVERDRPDHIRNPMIFFNNSAGDIMVRNRGATGSIAATAS